MRSSPASVDPVQNDACQTFWRRILAFVLRRRVALTSTLFVLLLIEDVINRVDPHNLTDFRDYKVVLGLGLVLSGLALRSWAAGTLHKRTTLTTSGPYGLVRHPLYIGSFLMMLGFCVLIDDAENIWFVLGPVLAIYVYRALHEEKVLAAAFPEQWVQFARSVPRFFPRRVPHQLFTNWQFSQWMKNREYQAVSATFLGLIGLQIWQKLYRP